MSDNTTAKTFEETGTRALMNDAALITAVFGVGHFILRYKEPDLIEIETFSEGGEASVTVKLPRLSEVVFEAQRNGRELSVRRYRPGAWATYLKRLAGEARRHQVKLEMKAKWDADAAFEPVDDAELFEVAVPIPCPQVAPKSEPSDAEQLVALLRHILRAEE